MRATALWIAALFILGGTPRQSPAWIPGSDVVQMCLLNDSPDENASEATMYQNGNTSNYVTSFVFPNGNKFAENSNGYIRIQLRYPTPSTIGRRAERTLASLVGRDDKTVFFKLVPAQAFAALLNETQINATGLTRVMAYPGDNCINIFFRVVDCLGGQPGQLTPVKIQTWMHDTNTNAPPDFIQKTFYVRCPQ